MSYETQSDIAIAEKQELQEAKKYNVIVHNNDITSYEEVIFIVSKVFEKTEEESFAIARKVDTEGKGVCGTYDGETADTKLFTVEMAKRYLINQFPHRAVPINALKFTKEEV
jgi:ATP-dependent Clp protease adaptor protein ClpS